MDDGEVSLGVTHYERVEQEDFRDATRKCDVLFLWRPAVVVEVAFLETSMMECSQINICPVFSFFFFLNKYQYTHHVRRTCPRDTWC